jgi:hypothetical protein
VTTFYTVSELLLERTVPVRLQDIHNVEAMALAMRHFKTRASKIVGGGGDCIVIQLETGNMLKITDKPWNHTWGEREIRTAQGVRQLDAKIIGTAQAIDLLNDEGTYYVQQCVDTTVKTADLKALNGMIEADGRFEFWDQTPIKHGLRQLGYEPAGNGQRMLVVIDYDAVRQPHLVPRNLAYQPNFDYERFLAWRDH